MVRVINNSENDTSIRKDNITHPGHNNNKSESHLKTGNNGSEWQRFCFENKNSFPVFSKPPISVSTVINVMQFVSSCVHYGRNEREERR